MEEYRPGERLRVIIEGAVRHAANGVVHITYGDAGIPFDERPLRSIVVDQPGVTIERLVPAEGMPKPGELWQDALGRRLLGFEHHDRYGNTGIWLSDGENAYYLKDLLKRGPLTPLYRDPEPFAGDVETNPEAWPVDEPEAPETVPIGGVTPGTLVRHKDWNDGKPVRIVEITECGEHFDEVAVAFQAVGVGQHASVIVPDGTQVTLIQNGEV